MGRDQVVMGSGAVDFVAFPRVQPQVSITLSTGSVSDQARLAANKNEIGESRNIAAVTHDDGSGGSCRSSCELHFKNLRQSELRRQS